MRTINIVGAGRVGQTLGRLWADAHQLRVQHVVNRSLVSAQHAVEFLGQGTAVERVQNLSPASVVMIAAGDGEIAGCVDALLSSGTIQRDCLVFHCSGALSSQVLSPLKTAGAHIAAAHPMKSFAQPSAAISSFAGTTCALEGDPVAVAQLEVLLHAIDAVTFHIDPDNKLIYHASAVFASNCLVALLEVALRCYEKAGVERTDALRILRPLVAGTVQNVFSLGPSAALTGPVARGDVALVRNQLAKLTSWDGDLAAVYRALGKITLELSQKQGSASMKDLNELRLVLAENSEVA